MAEPGPSRSGGSDRAGARLDVEVLRKATLWDRIAPSDQGLSRAARAAFRAGARTRHGVYDLALVLVDDSAMRNLNRIWRGKDAPTNVLSFPADQGLGEAAMEARPLGDVVLAAETVLREAEEQGIAAGDHVSHLVVHGVLHLLGFDHEREADAARMEALEIDVLARLGIADPYTEPAGTQAAGAAS